MNISKETNKPNDFKKSNRALNEQFRKRRNNFLKKANDIARISDAKVYVIIEKKGRLIIYNSEDPSSWPPKENDLRRYYPLPVRKSPADFNLKSLSKIKIRSPPVPGCFSSPKSPSIVSDDGTSTEKALFPLIKVESPPMMVMEHSSTKNRTQGPEDTPEGTDSCIWT
ncbi:MAG: hypothetical protein M1834_008506 [Cirrosporium novae-zelandiae]|nr:MAG: hypothetical protein M1834_008506 [Cirrosporium novae-zelandiae]